MCKHNSSRKQGDGFETVVEVSSDFLMGLNCPTSLKVWMLLKYGEHRQIADLSVDPLDYNNPDDFDSAYSSISLLRKGDFLDTKIDLKEAALSNFWLGEQLCEETNRRIIKGRAYVENSGHHAVIHTAARIIRQTLGDIDPESLLRGMGFGPGVSSSCKGDKVGAYYKSGSALEATAAAMELGRICINATHPLPAASIQAEGPCSLLISSMKRVKGNSLTFVPKDSKTLRPIAIEPHVNIFLQKGVGSYIRDRLRIKGINLNDQSVNADLARQGSRYGQLATIDLSMASDTVSIEIVRELLPEPWFNLLDCLRSKHGLVEGKYHTYSKFSSMGNGFTFELESLIFWALSKAVCPEGIVSVYGDDIILPSESYERLVPIFTFCGFKINATKSFHGSYFRESCGAHYFNGQVVTPPYIKVLGKGEDYRIKLHNIFFRWGAERYGVYKPVWLVRILKKLRRGSPLLVPPVLGDSGFNSDFPHTGAKRHRHFEGWVIKCVVNTPLTRDCKRYYNALYNSFVTTTIESPSKGKSPLRGRFRRNVRNIFVRSWSLEAPKDPERLKTLDELFEATREKLILRNWKVSP
nr:MAG: RNA dependent RNA polymerase [Leviviridae sp.]